VDSRIEVLKEFFAKKKKKKESNSKKFEGMSQLVK
jgi:hypothetical protein